MEHFKSSVSLELQDKMLSVANIVSEQMRYGGIVSKAEYYCDADVNIIEGNYVSGWIPKQDGGFSIDALIQCDADSTHHLTEKQTEFMDKQAADCWDQFLSDNVLVDIVSCYDDLTESQQEDLADYESEWFQPALLQVQIFVDGRDCKYSFEKGLYHESPNTVTLRLSVNYKDAPYYREKYAEDIVNVTLEIDEFMPMEIESIISLLKV